MGLSRGVSGLPRRSPAVKSFDATALRRGGSRSQPRSSQRETPRGEPVASGSWVFDLLATIVKLHGASPWHLL